MEASSRLRTAEPGDRIIAQARGDDKERIRRIALVRDAVVIQEEPVPPQEAEAEGLINYLLEKRTP